VSDLLFHLLEHFDRPPPIQVHLRGWLSAIVKLLRGYDHHPKDSTKPCFKLNQFPKNARDDRFGFGVWGLGHEGRPRVRSPLSPPGAV
jgi:hypothetical protein